MAEFLLAEIEVVRYHVEAPALSRLAKNLTERRRYSVCSIIFKKRTLTILTLVLTKHGNTGHTNVVNDGQGQSSGDLGAEVITRRRARDLVSFSTTTTTSCTYLLLL